MRCLGTNAHGKVGDGSSTWLDDVAEVVSCWGSNELGTLGFATTETCVGISRASACATRPGVVPGVDHVARLFLGVWGTCALAADHSVWCCGRLSPTRSMVPAPVEW